MYVMYHDAILFLGTEPVVVRNLKRSLRAAGPSVDVAAVQGKGCPDNGGGSCHGDAAGEPRKRKRVAVLISGTGEFSPRGMRRCGLRIL